MERMQGSKSSATQTPRAARTEAGSPALRRVASCGAVALLLACGACAQVSAQSAAVGDPVKELAAPAAISLPLKPNREFAKFPSYTGTLGSRRIVLRLGAKTDDPSGVHGEYQFADTGEVILIAGDRDGDTLEVEESNDGTHITGNWVGKFAPDGSLEGDRMNVDDSDPQPFDLHLAGGAPAAAPGAKPAPAAAAPVPAPAPAPNAHAVGGVSNLSTGD
ncbi:hypothetical protein FAZ69_08940 [Trinickia terrae]|uniref:Uncharacterized protein n=1 Tax=Trinickia terrae TaxID=2571161 RepID=A0A4U1I9V4_9BURK|nr:hypothetical protein [Trinickia terrae]TKC90259.1 hypothetical protein FAZ69_08940 [Trinickia terrae]